MNYYINLKQLKQKKGLKMFFIKVFFDSVLILFVICILIAIFI